MKILILVLAGVAVLGVSVSVYVRMSPIPPKALSDRSQPNELGEFFSAGGHRVVQLEPSAEEVAALYETILQTPRTVEVDTDLPNTRIFVHRSQLWGFPDVTHVVASGGHLIVDSHLVFGQFDLGANQARVKRWLSGV